MGLLATGKRVLEALGHLSTVVWLVGLAAGAISAARVGAVMPGGWLQNPFVPLAWFLSTLALVVIGGKAAEWGWKKTQPPSLAILSHGGRDVTLEIRPVFDDMSYGTARFIDLAIRSRPFDLAWSQSVTYQTDEWRIRAGDSGTVFLAAIDDHDSHNPYFVVYGEGGHVLRLSLKDELRAGFQEDSPWIEIRVEVRGKKTPNTWEQSYRFRLAKHARFEIEPVTMPSTVRTGAPSRSPSA